MQSQSGAEGFISRHRFVILFGTLVAFYVVATIAHQLREGLHPSFPPVIEGVSFLALLMGVVVSISPGRGWRLFAFLLGLVAAALLWLAGVVVVSDASVVIRHLFLAAFLGYVIWVMLRAIFDSRRVTFNTVCASLCIYLLLGHIWALAYSVVDVLDPAAFICTVDGGKSLSWRGVGEGDTGVLYFSFATLTTLGYGEFVPTSPVSRLLVITEAITGQLYLVVLVARLVGMHIVYSTGQEEPRGREPRDEERTRALTSQEPATNTATKPRPPAP
jgi:hypothetical protein